MNVTYALACTNVRGKMSFLSITQKRFEERKYESILPMFFKDPPLEKKQTKKQKQRYKKKKLKRQKTITNQVVLIFNLTL